ALSVRFLHQNGKAVEQVIDVVRSWARFRVALKTKRRPVGQLEALQAAIEQRPVSNAGVSGQRRGIDSKTVVLAGDHHAAGRKILPGMVCAVMAELHFHGLRTDREAEQLMAEADSEKRDTDAEERSNSANRVITRRGIPGTVREQNAIGLETERFFCRRF